MLAATAATINKQPEIKSNFVQFRVSDSELQEMTRIASLLYEKKIIKKNSISMLAKACTFTQINQFIAIENKQRMIQEYDRLKQLERSNCQIGVAHSKPNFNYSNR
jgi:hypothetical protein